MLHNQRYCEILVCLAARGHDPVEALEQKLRSPWGDPATVREIIWPLILRVGRAG